MGDVGLAAALGTGLLDRARHILTSRRRSCLPPGGVAEVQVPEPAVVLCLVDQLVAEQAPGRRLASRRRPPGVIRTAVLIRELKSARAAHLGGALPHVCGTDVTPRKIKGSADLYAGHPGLRCLHQTRGDSVARPEDTRSRIADMLSSMRSGLGAGGVNPKRFTTPPRRVHLNAPSRVEWAGYATGP